MDQPASRRWPRVVVGLALLAAIAAVLLSGEPGALSPAILKTRLLAAGPWGPVAFVVAYAALQPFGFSSHAFIVAASLVWSPESGIALSWLGTLAASSVAFGFARWMGQEWVQRRLPPRLRRWDDALATRGFRTVLVMRLLLFTFGPMQLMLGVSAVRFVPFLAATALGVLPLIVVESYAGAGLVAWLLG
jgi:uncharacterized membrane protein YdjX (TVP38/TMEM64 family)